MTLKHISGGVPKCQEDSLKLSATSSVNRIQCSLRDFSTTHQGAYVKLILSQENSNWK